MQRGLNLKLSENPGGEISARRREEADSLQKKREEKRGLGARQEKSVFSEKSPRAPGGGERKKEELKAKSHLKKGVREAIFGGGGGKQTPY